VWKWWIDYRLFWLYIICLAVLGWSGRLLMFLKCSLGKILSCDDLSEVWGMIGRNCAKWFIVSTKCKWMLNPAGLEMAYSTYRFNRAEVTEARSWCVPGAACTAALYYPVWGAQGMCSGWCVGAVWIMFGAEDLCIIAYGRGNIW